MNIHMLYVFTVYFYIMQFKKVTPIISLPLHFAIKTQSFVTGSLRIIVYIKISFALCLVFRMFFIFLAMKPCESS